MATSAIGNMVAKVLWRAPQRAGTASTPTREDICKCSQRLKLYSPVHNGRRAMWTLSTMQALIFVAAVAIAVALLLLA